MTNITDYLLDTAFLEKVLDFLNASYGISAFVTDKERNIIEINGGKYCECDVKRFYPFDFVDDIGGLTCTAGSETTLDEAEGHILVYLAGINNLLQRDLEIQQMSNEILELSEEISFMFHLEKKMSGIHKLNDFCEMTLHEIAKKIGADHAFIHVKDGSNDELTITHNLTCGEAVDLQKQGVFDRASEKKDTILSTTDNGMSLLVAPIVVKDGVIGFITFQREKGRKVFTAYEKKFLSIINNSISSMTEALRLYDNLRQLYLNTVKALAAAIDAKDPYTHGHSFRVAKYSIAMARNLKLPDKVVSDLEIAAYMHDLGKIGVSEVVLRKTEKLTADEYEEVKKHPLFTGKILEPIQLPKLITDTAIQHHERLDGSGYPYGLSGDAIALSPRIVAVADVFDALTSARTYRPAMAVEKALNILIEDVDRKFDRDVVAALILALKSEICLTELSDIYRDLQFADIQNLNHFLVGLETKLIE